MLQITSRQVQLMELMSQQSTYLPTKYYADKLNVSERTVFNDINKLADVLKEFQVEVKRKTNKGIKLSGKAVSSGVFYQQLLKNSSDDNVVSYQSIDRQILIMRWLLIENRTLTYQYLSLNLFVSTTSIVKDLDYIKTFMDDDVSLISDVRGTRINGTESGIQRTLKRFSYYILDKKGHNYSISSYGKQLEQLIDRNIIEQVKNAIEELKSVIENEISEQYLKSLFIFLLILTERSKAGHHIEDLSDIDRNENNMLENIPFAAQIGHTISNPLDFQFTFSEIHVISRQLYAHRFQVKINNRLIENLFDNDIEKLINRVSDTMDVDVTQDKNLYDSLVYHMFLMVYRLKSNIIVQNPLVDEVKSHYRTLFQMIWYSLEDFEKKYQVNITDDEVAFITIHFQVAFERKEQHSEILVVCQTGIVTSELITNRIKTLLPANIQFKLIAKSQLTEDIIRQSDFIISSVKLENASCPIVYVTPMINDEDLLNIYKLYLESTKRIKSISPSEKRHQNYNNYFDKRYISIQNNIKTKNECLDMMINQLEADNIVTEDFRKSVFDREKLGNTQVHYWIATPHGYSSEVKESKISIMLTQEPIRWNEDANVKLILLLAVAKEDISNVRILLGNFFKNIIHNENIINEVSSFTNLTQFTQLFHDITS